MNTQEIFNKIAEHLLAQNARSGKTYPNGSMVCRYRGEQGMSCAVGCLIKDEDYSDSLEGYTVDTTRVLAVLEKTTGRKLLAKELELLVGLQMIHDNEPVDTWRQQLLELAAEFKLKPKLPL